MFEEFSTISRAEFDAENRFRALTAGGSVADGLQLIDQLDAAFAGRTKRPATQAEGKSATWRQGAADPLSWRNAINATRQRDRIFRARSRASCALREPAWAKALVKEIPYPPVGSEGQANDSGAPVVANWCH